MDEYAVVNKTQLDADMTSVADTIRTKGGTSEKLSWPDEYKAAIKAIQTGGGAPVEVEEKDVNFYDYDGTLLYSYTIAEAQALTELPPLPSQKGLICQGWNWTLEDYQNWKLPADIGAIYTTDDGKTRLYLEITTILNMPMTLYFTQTASNGVEIDWGDGTEVQTISGTGNVNCTHNYSEVGKYLLTMNVVSGECSFDNGKVFGNNYARMNTIQKVEIGDRFEKIGQDALQDARSMKSITLSNSVVSGGTSSFRKTAILAYIAPRTMTSGAFGYNSLYDCGTLRVASMPVTAGVNGGTNNSCMRNCVSLRKMVISRIDATGINNGAFYGCAGLSQVVIAEKTLIESIGASAFRDCYSLEQLTVNASVVTIDASAFRNCYSIKQIKFLPKAPPTVLNADAFTNLPTDCIIEVPAGCLEAYTTATNYPSADTYTYVEASE